MEHPIDGDPSSEEVVIVRLQGLGTFALPLVALDGYRVPSAEDDGDVLPYAAGAAEAVPVIMAEDFLRGLSTGRGALVVDRLGAVSRTDHQALFVR